MIIKVVKAAVDFEKSLRQVDVLIKAAKENHIRKKVKRIYDHVEREHYPLFQEGVERYFRILISECRKGYKEAFSKAINPKTLTARIVRQIDWGFIESQGLTLFKPLYLGAIAGGGEAAYSLAHVEAFFDVVKPDAVKEAEKSTTKLIVEMTKRQKKAIRIIITAAVKAGASMSQIAKILNDVVGLHSRWALAVYRYEEKLIASGVKVDVARKRSGSYYKRLLRKRRMMIARTETAIAQARGSIIGYKRLGVRRVRFYAAHGACANCAHMDNTIYLLRTAYGVIPLHPNCRCDWLSIKPKAGYFLKFFYRRRLQRNAY